MMAPDGPELPQDGFTDRTRTRTRTRSRTRTRTRLQQEVERRAKMVHNCPKMAYQYPQLFLDSPTWPKRAHHVSETAQILPQDAA